MTDERRKIELEIEVPGTPEEVWQAIATGPGISSWYVPHTVEEKKGGAANASFGDAPEMQVAGRVAEWDPPHRIVMDGGDSSEGLVFEWLVEARDGGSCVVRLINSGFGQGGEWDDQYDAMHEGWLIFLSNLRLHLQHFAGQSAITSLPMTYVPANADTAWSALAAALGIPETAEVGETVTTSGDGVPRLSGTVAGIANPNGIDRKNKFLLKLDEPAAGTAFIGAESHGEMSGISIWTYLYGPDAKAATESTKGEFQRIVEAVAAELQPEAGGD